MAKTTKDEENQAPPPDAPAAPAAPAGELLTPLEWAIKKGLQGEIDKQHPWRPIKVDPIYAAAQALHGWLEDAHHYQTEGQELRLAEVDFDKALEAAGKYPAVPAHGPACGRLHKDRAQPVRDPHTKAILAEGKTVHAPKIQAVKSNG